MSVEDLLAEIEPLLYGHNYQVFLRVYRVAFTHDSSLEAYIVQALGPSTAIGGVVPVTKLEILMEVEQSLRYAGDEGSGPENSVLISERFNGLVRALLSGLDQELSKAMSHGQFWLQSGHPAYPVFWDFAFVSVGLLGALVFVGSSSD